jgi:hypothetical protein
MKMTCACVHIHCVNQGKWKTSCPRQWIFFQQYVISLCDTSTQYFEVGLRVASDFDIISAFLVTQDKAYTTT